MHANAGKHVTLVFSASAVADTGMEKCSRDRDWEGRRLDAPGLVPIMTLAFTMAVTRPWECGGHDTRNDVGAI